MAVLGGLRFLISEVPLYTLPPNLQSPTLHTLYTLTSTPRRNLDSQPLDLTALDGEVSVVKLRAEQPFSQPVPPPPSVAPAPVWGF